MSGKEKKKDDKIKDEELKDDSGKKESGEPEKKPKDEDVFDPELSELIKQMERSPDDAF